jgi:hypothetical protein
MTLIASVYGQGKVDFLGELVDELTLKDKYQIEREYNGGADMVIRDPKTGKIVAIELKDAGNYGELPISTILPISRMVKQFDHLEKFFLITFSQVPILLSEKLKELNVDALTQPTVHQVVEQVEQALSA